MKKLALLATILILALLYIKIDRQAFIQQFRGMHLGFFGLALSFFIPQVAVTTWRWRWMIWDLYPMRTWEAARLILAGKALNALLPSKLGETSKAYFLHTQAGVDLSHGVALVLLEKVFDVAGLCAMLLLGMILTPHMGPVEISATLVAFGVLGFVALLCSRATAWVRPWLQSQRRVVQRLNALLESWESLLAQWWQHPPRFAGILLSSCFLWSLHLLQITLFFVALRSTVGVKLVFAYVPISIFIGLLPITIGGMGTRDSALIVLFAPYETTAVMAAIGLLCSLRYWLDSLLGLPFFHAYSLRKDD